MQNIVRNNRVKKTERWIYQGCCKDCLTVNPSNIEKSTTKALSLVEKVDYMIQQRQIVIKAFGIQIDIEDSAYTKYAGTSFQFIAWMLIFDIVTIKRNSAVLERYENNHCIMLTTKLLRSCIKNYEH